MEDMVAQPCQILICDAVCRAYGAFFLAASGSTAEYIGLLGAIGRVAQLDFHAVLYLGPIVLIEQFTFEGFEHGFRCTHQIEGIPFTQLVQVIFTNHASIHHPYSSFVAVLEP